MIRPSAPFPTNLPSGLSEKPAAAEPLHREANGSRRRHWLRNAVPLLTSLSMHAGLIVIGILFFTAYQVINRPDNVELQPIISETRVMPHETPVVDPQTFGLGTDFQTAQDNIRNVTNPWIARTPGPEVKITDNPGGPDVTSTAVISPGLRTSHIGHPGPSVGPGEDEGGGPARFGINSEGSKVFIHPPGQLPLSVAYVCDASGSMMGKMDTLKQQLSSEVHSLRSYQQFSIIFFQDEQPTMLSSRLLAATPENKQSAAMFLEDVQTKGTTDPIPGIQKAFAQNPQMMFLLTDGDFPHNDQVLAEIRRLEKAHHVVINTIAFTDAGDTEQDFKTLLRQVATETGGTFKAVDADSLGADQQ